MASREEKEAYIREYAKDLADLAEGYTKCTSIIDSLSDDMVNAMYTMAVQGNSAHEVIANDLEAAEKR